MAGIQDVAQRAGVSIATVSRVLSPGPTPHAVNPATAARVRAAAAELDYVPSALARGLVSRHSGLLGFLVPSLADPHYPHIARGAEDRAREHGLALLVCNTLGDSRRLADYLRVLRARKVDALIVSGGSSLSGSDLAALEATRLPTVLIGRPSGESTAPWVGVDNRSAAREATEHLLRSRRHVVHLAGPPTQTTMADRADGYRDAMADAGAEAEVVATSGTPQAGEEAARLLLHRGGRRPEAFFAATDRLAIGALGVAIDLQLSVPEALALVGFDDLPLGAYLRPRLSTVAQPGRELGAAAIGLALALLADEPARPVILPARLIMRGSS